MQQLVVVSIVLLISLF